MTLYRRPETTFWYYEFTVEGKRHRGSTKTTSKREAAEVKARLMREAREDAAKARLGMKRMTVFDLAHAWLKTTEYTHKDHKGNVSRVRKLFGNELRQQGKEWVEVPGARFGISKTLMVHDVKQGLLLELRDARIEEDCAPATINREMSLLQSLMGYAESMSVVMPERPIVWSQKRNRAASLKMKEPKGKLRWLTQAQAHQLTQTLLERWAANQGDMIAMDNYDLACILLDTGCRYDEIAKITWSQVNRASGYIDLYRNKTDNESKMLNTQRVKAILDRRWELQGGRFSYVFPALRGRNWLGLDKPRGHATAGIQGVLDRMGLNDDPTNTRVTPHTFRDTFASWLVQAGVSLFKVSKLLGHADVKMTEKYAHLCPDATGREAMDVLDRMAPMKVAEGDDPKRPSAPPMKVAEGDDPKPSHIFHHTEANHSQQLASRFAAENLQVLDTQRDSRVSVVGRAGLEPATNGL
jgi:integrase